jgi:hypothetical protein
MVMEIFKTLLKTGFNFSRGFPLALDFPRLSRGLGLILPPQSSDLIVRIDLSIIIINIIIIIAFPPLKLALFSLLPLRLHLFHSIF